MIIFIYYFVPLFPIDTWCIYENRNRCWIFNLNSRVDVVRFIDMGVSKYLDNDIILLYENLT
jgi:hypothetical protein